MTVLAMSHGELSRYDTLRRFERGELRIEDAVMLLGVGRRQVYRLLGRLRRDGPEGLVSSKRGRPSNRAFKAEMRTNVLSLVREHYHDFGPTLAAEYLVVREQSDVCFGAGYTGPVSVLGCTQQVVWLRQRPFYAVLRVAKPQAGRAKGRSAMRRVASDYARRPPGWR